MCKVTLVEVLTTAKLSGQVDDCGITNQTAWSFPLQLRDCSIARRLELVSFTREVVKLRASSARDFPMQDIVKLQDLRATALYHYKRLYFQAVKVIITIIGVLSYC